MAKVYLTDLNFDGVETLRAHLGGLGYDLVQLDARDEREVAARASDADALIVQFLPIGSATLNELGRLKAIVRLGVGLDNIACEAAATRGIHVRNVPDYCVDEVADHTWALLLACARRVMAHHHRVRRGEWTPSDSVPTVLRELTLGIVGLGRIGQAVLARAEGFGVHMLGHDPAGMRPDGVRLVGLDHLLAACDLITLHLPLTPQTRHLIDDAALARMRPGVAIVNTARGGLVDEDALARHLDSGQVSCAALDVLEEEPPSPDHPLLRRDDVLVTPHIAYLSDRSPRRLLRSAAETLHQSLTSQTSRA